MATLPSYVRVDLEGYAEEFDPSVLRTEMERGPPKQRIENTKIMQKITCRFVFLTKADCAAFENWYFSTIGRVGYFDMKHPRTGATISVRFENGRLGALMPLTPDLSVTARQVTVEYLR